MPAEMDIDATPDTTFVKIEPQDQIVKVFYRFQKTLAIEENIFWIHVEFASITAASSAELSFSIDHPMLLELETTMGK